MSFIVVVASFFKPFDNKNTKKYLKNVKKRLNTKDVKFSIETKEIYDSEELNSEANLNKFALTSCCKPGVS